MEHSNIIWATRITEEENNYLQATYYEMVGARNLAVHAVVSIPEAYERLQKDYIKALTIHETLLEELRVKYVPKEYRTNRYRMNVAFDDCELMIEDANAR